MPTVIADYCTRMTQGGHNLAAMGQAVCSRDTSHAIDEVNETTVLILFTSAPHPLTSSVYTGLSIEIHAGETGCSCP